MEYYLVTKSSKLPIHATKKKGNILIFFFCMNRPPGITSSRYVTQFPRFLELELT